MALRGVKPEEVKKRFKAFFYGKAKVGKTTAAISFPKPYLIDTERGAENTKYTNVLKQNGGVIFQTNDFDEVVNEIKCLLTENHEYKTLIIDPLTIIYDDLLDKISAEIGTEYGKHVHAAGKRMKNLYSLLLRLDMNVIITSHAKTEYEMIGKELTVVGQTFDCYKKMDYMFDLVLHIQKRGKNRVAFVTGTRLDEFKEDETFDFSYEEICGRYGKDILEKECISTLLASPEQIKEIKHLIEILHIEQAVVEKMFKKEEVDGFEFMSEDYIKKCINHFKSKIQGEAA